jgi:hypothetical protein
VAVNVIDDPEQLGFVPLVKAIAKEGTRVAFTVIVIPLLVAEVGLAQGEFEVITQVTTSLFTKVVVVNVAELVPAFTPFTFH